MMNIRHVSSLVGALLLTLTLSACVSQIMQSQLSQLDKGISSSETASRLKSTPLASETITLDARTFVFQRYQLNNGVQSDTYLLAFEDGRLLYWGYPSEFRRLSDVTLNQALTQVLPALTRK